MEKDEKAVKAAQKKEEGGKSEDKAPAEAKAERKEKKKSSEGDQARKQD